MRSTCTGGLPLATCCRSATPSDDGFRKGFYRSAGSEGIERSRVHCCVEPASLASHSPIRVTEAIRLGFDSNKTLWGGYAYEFKPKIER